ncbi:Lactoylglutathione lyase GLX1 [Bienertia sinuspersici]
MMKACTWKWSWSKLVKVVNSELLIKRGNIQGVGKVPAILWGMIFWLSPSILLGATRAKDWFGHPTEWGEVLANGTMFGKHNSERPSIFWPAYYGVDQYDIGTGFGHFAIATPDVYKMVEDIRAKGGTITREPGPDPTGYVFELIQRGSTPEPLCQVLLRVGNLERSIMFYEKALGMKVVKKTDRPEQKYAIAMMGYAPKEETTVLELTYNYGVTNYTKGNAYALVSISTDDVYKSAEVVNLANQELGGKITRQPGPIPGLNTKIVSFLDPDGWKSVSVLVLFLQVTTAKRFSIIKQQIMLV